MPLRPTYESRTVLEIFRWLEIDGRGGDGSAEAVFSVSTHDYGTAGCSDQYLIGRASEAPRVEPLVVDGDPCWRIFGVKRNGSGLLLTREASPGYDGSVRSWTPAAAAAVLQRRRQFAPRRGTRMADFRPHSSLTDNEEFFDALRFAAPNDWRPLGRGSRACPHARGRHRRKTRDPTTCADPPRACPYEQVFAACVSGSCFFARERYDRASGEERGHLLSAAGPMAGPSDRTRRPVAGRRDERVEGEVARQ